MTRTKAVLGWVLGVALLGCGDQVDGEYRGERLLLVSAKITGLAEEPDTDIEPILAYDDGAQMHFEAVDVAGDFPPGFQLSVYDAPPTPWGVVGVLSRRRARRADHTGTRDPPR